MNSKDVSGRLTLDYETRDCILLLHLFCILATRTVAYWPPKDRSCGNVFGRAKQSREREGPFKKVSAFPIQYIVQILLKRTWNILNHFNMFKCITANCMFQNWFEAQLNQFFFFYLSKNSVPAQRQNCRMQSRFLFHWIYRKYI